MRLLRGIEAGIVGGLAMLLLLATASIWDRHVWWEAANILGSTFYGMRAMYAGPGAATLAGASLNLVITGTVGGIFGIICGNFGSRRRLILAGIAAALAWYYLANAFFWPHVNRLVPLYSPQQATLLSHGIFGLCLGFIGWTRPQPSESSQNSVAKSFTDAVES